MTTQRPAKFTKQKMGVVHELLAGALGSLWSVHTVEKTSDDNVFDPPCRYVEGRLFDLRVTLCDNGQFHFFRRVSVGRGSAGEPKTDHGLYKPPTEKERDPHNPVLYVSQAVSALAAHARAVAYEVESR
jgi:hypothetical protein